MELFVVWLATVTCLMRLHTQADDSSHRDIGADFRHRSERSDLPIFFRDTARASLSP
jgi:hypothetical protein